MQIESGYIFLNELRFHAFHGVMPQERKVGAEFLVTVRIGYDLTKAMLSDEVEDTLNYAAVYALIAEEMSVDIWLTKVNPPMGADGNGAGVELHLINDKTHG